MIPKRKVTGRSARRVVVVSVLRALGSELVLDPIIPGVEKCSPEDPGDCKEFWYPGELYVHPMGRRLTKNSLASWASSLGEVGLYKMVVLLRKMMRMQIGKRRCQYLRWRRFLPRWR